MNYLSWIDFQSHYPPLSEPFLLDLISENNAYPREHGLCELWHLSVPPAPFCVCCLSPHVGAYVLAKEEF